MRVRVWGTRGSIATPGPGTNHFSAKPGTEPLPVLMLTAMTDEPTTRAGFEAGVTDYVTKPFSIPQLTARVRACLARTRLA